MTAVAPVASPRRRRTQAERREEAERLILDAAVRLVAEKGLDEFTLADAGEAAGYSRGLPAHYFGSKADLLSAVADHIREWFSTGLRTRVDRRRRGLTNLIAGIDFYIDACGTDRNHAAGPAHRIGWCLAQTSAGPGNCPAQPRDRPRRSRAPSAAGIANGEIRRNIDVRAWSVLILSSVRGIVAQWLVDPDHVDLPPLRASLIAVLKRNFAP